MDKFDVQKSVLKPMAEPSVTETPDSSAAPASDENALPRSTTNITDSYKRAIAFFDEAKNRLQELKFSEPFPKKEYWVAEVNDEILKAVEEGKPVVFRGDITDPLVMCTSSTTYSIVAQLTSNTMLLTPDLKVGAEVEDAPVQEGRVDIVEAVSLQSQILELSRVPRPSVARARELLKVQELKWGAEYSSDDGLPTFDLLLDRVQMSERELRALLERWPVVEIDGFLRWLSVDFRDNLLNEIVDACDGGIEGITTDRITFDNLHRFFEKHSLNDEIIHWFLRTFCSLDDDMVNWRLKERAIVRARVAQLLRAANHIDLPTFERLLDQLLPHPFTLKYDYLEGLALVDKTTLRGATVQYLNVDDLPEDPRERLELLFRVRAEWTREDLEPYLEDICESKAIMAELLVNLCRATDNAQGQHVFCALR